MKLKKKNFHCVHATNNKLDFIKNTAFSSP